MHAPARRSSTALALNPGYGYGRAVLGASAGNLAGGFVGRPMLVPAAEPTVDNWIAEMDEKGIDGAALVEDARALVEKHSN